MFGFWGIFFQFFTEIHYKIINCPGGGHGFVTPDFVKQIMSVDGFSFMFNQVFQDRKFLRCSDKVLNFSFQLSNILKHFRFNMINDAQLLLTELLFNSVPLIPKSNKPEYA